MDKKSLSKQNVGTCTVMSRAGSFLTVWGADLGLQLTTNSLWGRKLLGSVSVHPQGFLFAMHQSSSSSLHCELKSMKVSGQNVSLNQHSQQIFVVCSMTTIWLWYFSLSLVLSLKFEVCFIAKFRADIFFSYKFMILHKTSKQIWFS